MDTKLKTYFTNHQNPDSLFISFEGIEGSGKSTQIQRIKAYLENLGKTVHVFREPGGTNFGEKLREAILLSESPLEPISEAYLFASSRAQLLTQEILPKLKSPQTVIIADRYIDSSLAYQGIARGLGAETILNIHKHAPLNILPDITFYLEIDTKTSLTRQENRGSEKDYFEREKADFYDKLINGFKISSELFPQRIKRIDAKNNIDQVSNDIKDIIHEHYAQ